MSGVTDLERITVHPKTDGAQIGSNVLRIATIIVLLFVGVAKVQAARYVGSVTQPDTVPPGSCCDITSLVKFVGVGGVPDVIDPANWIWSFDVDFDPSLGITINSMTLSTHSADFFPDQPNLSFGGTLLFTYPVGLQPLSPTATPNRFTIPPIKPEQLRVQGDWTNFGVETPIDSVVTAGVGNTHAFAFDFTNYPASIGASCDPGGANICDRADYAAPANIFEAPGITFAPYYTLGQVRSFMSQTATLVPVPEPTTLTLAALILLRVCNRRCRSAYI